MRAHVHLRLALCALALGFFEPSSAANGHESPATGTADSVRGEVVRLLRVSGREERDQEVHLVLNTDNGLYMVHLAPAWYLDRQPVKLEPRDKVEVRGMRLARGSTWETPGIIAAQVIRGDETLDLRDAAGQPLWTRTGRHARGVP
jgi:hypothetical protein